MPNNIQNHYLRRCPAKSKKVQVFNEVIQDLARIQSNGSPTRPGFMYLPYCDKDVGHCRVQFEQFKTYKFNTIIHGLLTSLLAH